MLLVLSFVFFMLLGLPLFGVIGLASIISMIGMPFPMEFIPQNLYTGMDQFPLIATIGFVMAGFLMEPAGITGEIIEVAKKAVGNIRGGLAMVTILACMIFAALSGSGPATTAAIGSIMIPGMIAAGYRKDDAAAVSATGGTLGILIPPSNPMIIYGVVANTSIAGLFMAGFIPGFVLTSLMCITAYCIAKKRGYQGTNEKFSIVGLCKAIWDGKWALATPAIILGGIYSGMLTATESAAIAVVWAAIAGLFIYKELTVKELVPILKDSAKSSAMILFIIAASTAFSWVFTFSGASQALVNAVISMHLNSALFCFVVAIILLIFGTFMEGTAIAVLLVPVLWPIAQSMGIDVIHFGMIVCISNVVGTMTPPVAVNIFSASTVSGLKMGDIAKAEIPFLIGYVAVFFCCVFSETFCTFLI